MRLLVRRTLGALLGIALALGSSGCLGTVVQTPARKQQMVATTNAHLLAAPFRIDAHICSKGLARVTTFIPVWGIAVGIFTLGIIVPKTTIYYCVEAR